MLIEGQWRASLTVSIIIVIDSAGVMNCRFSKLNERTHAQQVPIEMSRRMKWHYFDSRVPIVCHDEMAKNGINRPPSTTRLPQQS